MARPKILIEELRDEGKEGYYPLYFGEGSRSNWQDLIPESRRGLQHYFLTEFLAPGGDVVATEFHARKNADGSYRFENIEHRLLTTECEYDHGFLLRSIIKASMRTS